MLLMKCHSCDNDLPRPGVKLPLKSFLFSAQPMAVLKIAALVTTVSLSSGCTFLREAIGIGAQKPRVQLAGIQVSKVSLDAMELSVSLRVDNPNDFELRFAKLDYSLAAGGLSLAAGSFAKQIIIPATGTAYVKLPLVVDAKNAIQLADHMLKDSQETEALIKATADFDSPLGVLAVSIEEKRPMSKIFGN